MTPRARPIRGRERGFTVREAARRLRMPPRTVRYYGGKWGRDGYGRLVTPEIADAGQGTAKLFSLRNLVQLRVAFLLRGTGLPEDETRHLLSAKGAGGQDWWDPANSLGPDAVLLVRGEPHLRATDNWSIVARDLRGTPADSWAAVVFQAAGPEFELVQARYPAGWQPRFAEDDRDCWVLRGARRVWVINLGQIRKAVAQ
jgi:DNA-binding transcriptional MerR regulator